MQATIISDTSCLILLDKIDALQLLRKLYITVIVTQVVAEEFNKQLLEWIAVQNPKDVKNEQLLLASLDKGEASSIALALEQKNCRLIIDEQKGRKVARKLGLTITETLGVLAGAKQLGFIPILKPVFEKIKQTDFRLSEELLNEVLIQVGE